jgi:hypothetical protein
MALNPNEQQAMRMINAMARARRINTAAVVLPLLGFGYAI